MLSGVPRVTCLLFIGSRLNVISQCGTIRLSALPRASCRLSLAACLGLHPRGWHVSLFRLAFQTCVIINMFVCPAENIISAPEPTFSGVVRVSARWAEFPPLVCAKQTISKANAFSWGKVPCGSPSKLPQINV